MYVNILLFHYDTPEVPSSAFSYVFWTQLWAATFNVSSTQQYHLPFSFLSLPSCPTVHLSCPSLFTICANSAVCSEHFSQDSFYETKCGLRRIKNGAVPLAINVSIYTCYILNDFKNLVIISKSFLLYKSKYSYKDFIVKKILFKKAKYFIYIIKLIK